MNLQKWKSNSYPVMKKIESVMTLLDGQGNACSTVTNIEEEDETFARSMKEHSVASQNQPSRVNVGPHYRYFQV